MATIFAIASLVILLISFIVVSIMSIYSIKLEKKYADITPSHDFNQSFECFHLFPFFLFASIGFYFTLFAEVYGTITWNLLLTTIFIITIFIAKKRINVYKSALANPSD